MLLPVMNGEAGYIGGTTKLYYYVIIIQIKYICTQFIPSFEDILVVCSHQASAPLPFQLLRIAR